MSFDQIMTILRARWRTVAYTFFSVLALVLIGTFLWPKQFTGSASVVVDGKSDPVASAAAGNGLQGQAMTTYVNTQADIIGSPRVAQRVVRTLKLDQTPEARDRWAKQPTDDISMQMANYIIDRKLTVAPLHDSPTHGSSVIEIDVKWSDPVTAAALANAFAQVAIETNIELKVQPAKEYASWFEQRAKTLRTELAAVQKKLSDYQNANGIVATDDKLDVETSRLNELSTQLTALQSVRQESQSRQHQAGGDYESLPEVLASPVVQSLKSQLALAEAKRQDVAAGLGKNHPDYQAVEAEITNLRSRIAHEASNIAASLGTTTQVNVRRENELRASLEAQKKRVLDLKHDHDQAAVLLGDVTAKQRDYDEVMQRLAQSNLESVTQQTNVVQLTRADPPNSPSSPKLFLNLLIGIFLGGVAGIGAAMAGELGNRRVREDADMVALLGVPLIGRIGTVTPPSAHARLTQSTTPGRMEPAPI